MVESQRAGLEANLEQLRAQLSDDVCGGCGRSGPSGSAAAALAREIRETLSVLSVLDAEGVAVGVVDDLAGRRKAKR